MPQRSVSEADPAETWAALCSNRKTLLIDVRTKMEWQTIGVPDLTETGTNAPAFIEWQMFPSMQVNPDFVADAQAAIAAADAQEVFFICRSGVRSLHAAYAVAGADSECVCVNVIGGFEGDPDAVGVRGRINGWQAQGLPSRQD
jgi:rhodanese-related sulfurtransferase